MKPRHHVLLVLAWMLVLAPTAHAYLDPGTMSMVLQGLIAGVAAVAVVSRAYWGKIKQLFGMAPASSEGSKEPADQKPSDS